MFAASMLHNAILGESLHPDLAGELDRVRRIGLALVDPDDLNIVHRYIAELEARLALSAEDRPSSH